MTEHCEWCVGPADGHVTDADDETRPACASCATAIVAWDPLVTFTPRDTKAAS